ncbi:sigma-54-dependent Fis family transcriptional regulator [bacterium]|nr:sigma-54-dependent Fis family transcriptional regulator [candidate division CSSED10-310 bacterium]
MRVSRRPFKILVQAAPKEWEDIRGFIPVDGDVLVAHRPLGIELDLFAANLFLVQTGGSTFDSLPDRIATGGSKVAIIGRGLTTASIVRLVRRGFAEVFDLDRDGALIHDWVIRQYEDHLAALHADSSGVPAVSLPDLIGESPAMVSIRELADQAAGFSDLTVLLQGETGTGKEMVARYIHQRSGRAAGPFVEVNCAAIPESLMEAEMLGHERGAFTDARRTKKGFFELAHGGTLFLDEIGSMSLHLQNKILKIVEEKTFRRIGGEHSVAVDIKVITGTNANLADAIRDGRFRPDLYYRLNVFSITIPALRERRADIPLLADHFLSAFSSRYNLSIPGFHPSTINLLAGYSWPGNVRELKHIVERSAVMAGRGRILPTHLPDSFQECVPAAVPTVSANNGGVDSLQILLPDEGVPLESIDRLVVRRVLAKCDGNQSQAARYLGISRTRLARKLAGEEEKT